MSPRELIQDELAEWLSEHPKFNAPYGIIKGMKPYARGQARTITFGISRFLDGEITIVSDKLLSVSGRGPLAYKYAGNYKSVKELKEKFL